MGLDGLQVAVVGLGPMGRGIARVFDGAGAQVAVVDATKEQTMAGFEQLEREAAADGRDLRSVISADLAAGVAGAGLVIEAIVERLEAKQALLAELAAVASDETVVASNTSSISIGELGAAYGRPEVVVGMHFFNPPTKMRLVEVIAGDRTAEAVVARALGWVQALDKTAVRCRDSPNFIVNRVCRPLYYEAQLLVTQGVEPAVVDVVARRALGHPVGPLELLDAVGIHTHLGSSETALREFGDPRYRPIPIARRLVRAGLTGRAAGRGFYDHDREPPRAGRERVLRPPPPGDRLPAAEGPGASALAGRLRIELPPADGTRPVIYACRGVVDDTEVWRVAGQAAEGRRVVVDSSDRRWLNDLPSGAGWIRLHDDGERRFAEVVDDPVAGIVPTPAVFTVLGGLACEWVAVPALPGLVADRLRAALLNEATSVVEEGTATADDVDLALRLGMNHPAGPFEQLADLGPELIVATLQSMLDGFGDSRYRPTPLLLRQAAGASRRRN
jgi:3-hydroxybutyryl-CoA dehydrogenase